MLPNIHWGSWNPNCPSWVDQIDHFFGLEPLRVITKGERAIVWEGLKMEGNWFMIWGYQGKDVRFNGGILKEENVVDNKTIQSCGYVLRSGMHVGPSELVVLGGGYLKDPNHEWSLPKSLGKDSAQKFVLFLLQYSNCIKITCNDVVVGEIWIY